MLLAEFGLQDLSQHAPTGVAGSLVLLLGWVVRHLAGELRRERDRNVDLAELNATLRERLGAAGVQIEHLEEVTSNHSRRNRR